MSLRRLEKSMQTKLVKRTPKGVELTATGSALLSHLGQLRLAHKDVTREVADLAQGHAGDLRVAVQPGTAEDLAAPAGATLLRDSPKVTLQVTAMSFDLMIPGLRNGEFDLLVGGVPPASCTDFIHEILLQDENVIYASATHRLATYKRVTLTDFAGERWVKTANAGRSWKALCRACEEAGLPPPRDVLETNSSVVRGRAVAFGGLLALGAGRRVREYYARQWPIVILPVSGFSAFRDVAVTYRKDGYLSPAARRLIEILKPTAGELQVPPMKRAKNSS